jgi:hypothetical protein
MSSKPRQAREPMPTTTATTRRPKYTPKKVSRKAGPIFETEVANWYRGFWRTDALPLGLIALMILLVLAFGIKS